MRALSMLQGKEAPQPGHGLVPLEGYLRGQGLNPVANALLVATQRSNLRMQKITGGNAPGRPLVPNAARSLPKLKQVAERQVAPSLDIRMGFSDADGY